MPDLTCIYYTHNKENPEFEKRIRQSLLDSLNGTQLISVSHKPLDFGENICVGELIPSTHNAMRQLQLGAINAKTRFVCTAESDTLYPVEYLQFIPDQDDRIYKADNIYSLSALNGKTKYYHRKPEAEGAIVAGKDYLIDVIQNQLSGKKMWETVSDYDGSITPYLFNFAKCSSFHNVVPIIQIKTDNNMHRKAAYIKGSNLKEVPYWGDSHELLRQYL